MSTLITTTVQGVQTVKYDASTTAFTVGSDGTMTINQAPIQKCISFKAGIASNPSIAGQSSPIPFSDVTDSNTGCHNVGGHYNTSDYKFTVPRTGIYFLGVQILSASMGGGDTLEVYIQREDADGSNDQLVAIGSRMKYSNGATGYGGYMEGKVFSTSLRTAGEKIYFSAYRTGSSGTVHNNNSWSYCFGHYLGSA